MESRSYSPELISLFFRHTHSISSKEEEEENDNDNGNGNDNINDNDNDSLSWETPFYCVFSKKYLKICSCFVESQVELICDESCQH